MLPLQKFCSFGPIIYFVYYLAKKKKKKRKKIKGRRIRKKFVSLFRSFVFITNALMELFEGYITRLLENFWKSYWRLGETVMLVLAQVSSTFPSIIINQRQKHFKYMAKFFSSQFWSYATALAPAFKRADCAFLFFFDFEIVGVLTEKCCPK